MLQLHETGYSYGAVHTLVVWEVDGERDFEIIHPGCDSEWHNTGYKNDIYERFTCDLEEEIINAGLDSLEPDWRKVEPGEYKIRAWHHTYNDFEYGPQWDGGLEYVNDDTRQD